MHKKNLLVKMVTPLVLAVFVSPAFAQEGFAPNGDYSLAGFSLNRTKYANDICVPLGDCHQGNGGLGLHVSYQIIPNLLVGLNSASGQSTGNTSTLKESQGGLFIGFVMGVGDYFDVGGLLSPVTKKSEACLGSLCLNSEDTGTEVGLFGKWWLNDEKTFNIGMNLDSYAYSKDTTKYSSSALSLAYLLAGHHELSVTGARLRDSAGTDVNSTFSLGYNYHFR